MMTKTTLPLLLAALLTTPVAAAATAAPAIPAAAPAPRGINDTIGDVDVRDLGILSLARLASELSGINVVATAKAAERSVTLFLRNTTVRHLIDNVCRVSGLWYRYDPESNTYLIMTSQEFQRDVVVFRADHTKVLSLKHHNVVSAANAIKALYGSRVTLTDPVEEGLSVSSIDSPLSSRRTPTGSQSGRSSSRSGGSSSGGSLTGLSTAQTSGGGQRGSQQGSSISPSAALANMSMDRLQTVAGATEGTVTRLASGDIEQLDQTREPPIYVTFNRLHNFLLLRTGDDQVLKEIEDLVARLDKPARQVLLEMKVLELSKGDDFRSAFDLDFSAGPERTGPTSSQPRNPLTNSGSIASQVLGGINPFTSVDQSSSAIFQLMSNRIRARLQLLQSDNRVNVLATPMLLASNNQPSRLFIGEERVLTTGASGSQTSNETSTSTLITVETEQRDVGNTLIIVPRINDDRSVSISIDLDSSEVEAGGGTVPVGVGDELLQVPIDVVNTSNLQATVLAKDGLTVAIGGMIRVEKTRKQSKVPLLGDLPGLGFFFKTDDDNRNKSEVVLLITPHVIDSPEEGEVRTRERLGELMSNPAADLPGLMAPKPPAKAQPEQPAPPTAPLADEDRLEPGALARAAAARLDNPAADAGDGLLRQALPAMPAFFLDDGKRLAARPLASWRRGRQWVTALRLANLGAMPLELGTKDFPGAWRAAALDSRRLAPAGEAGDWTRAYLVSELPFEVALPEAVAAREVPE